MTASDVDTVLAVLLAEDVAAQQSLSRMHELACIAMREAPTAEQRTAARLEVLRLEKAIGAR